MPLGQVVIGGATGGHAEHINGRYELSEVHRSYREVFRKRGYRTVGRYTVPHDEWLYLDSGGQWRMSWSSHDMWKRKTVGGGVARTNEDPAGYAFQAAVAGG